MEIEVNEEILDEKKKKKPYSSVTYTTGDPQLNIDHFNKMLTGKEKNTHTDGLPSMQFSKEAEKAAENIGTFAAPSPDGASSVSLGGEVSSSGEAGGIGESLELHEDKIFAAKMGGYVDLPTQIKIIPQKEIEAFISKLEPEELFTVGYATPIYFYKKLLDKFTLIKCTEMIGYTGVDYRDANLKTFGKDAEKIAKAKDQIANPTVSDNGRVKSNIAGMRKDYADVNKTVRQADQKVLTKDVTTGENKIEEIKNLNTILFYPANNSKPKTKYFIDVHDGHGYAEISKEFVVETIYNKVREIILRDTASGKLKKDEDMTDIEQTFLKTVEEKAEHVIESDAATSDNVVLSSDATTNVKPSVRALYTNQIYYLANEIFIVGGKPQETLGKPLIEQILDETKRYVRRYYMKPQNIWLSNKDEVLKALIDHEDEDCVIYTLINLGDTKDPNKLNNADIIYYYEDGILYDKNHVRIMDYDLAIKHEEERPHINPETTSDAKLAQVYADRMTDATDLEEDIENELNLDFTDSKLEETNNHCCICGEEIVGYGNNAEPYKHGRCCDACNLKFVIPARLDELKVEREK